MTLLLIAAAIANAIGVVLPFVYISMVGRPASIRLAAVAVGLACLLIPLVVEHSSGAGGGTDLYFTTVAGAIPALGGLGCVVARRPRSR